MKKTIIVLLLCTVLCAAAFAQKGGSTPGQETIVFLGASWTAGYSATIIGKEDKSKSYPAFFQKYVSIPVINAGVSGNTTAQGLARVKKDVLSKNPGIVVIAFDLVGNDWQQDIPLATIKNNFQKIIDMVNDGKRKIYLDKYYPMAPSPKSGKVVMSAQAKKMYDDLASSNNIDLIDGNLIFDDVENHMAVEKNQYHPNAAGQEILADNYFMALKPYLEANNLLSTDGRAKAEQTATGIKYSWNFSDPANRTAGWFVFPEGHSDFHGTAEISRDDKTFGKGMLRLDIDYSKDSKSGWSEPKIKMVFDTPIEGVRRIRFDFIYNQALIKSGGFKSQVIIFSGNKQIYKNTNQMFFAEDQLANGYEKAEVSMSISASTPIDSIILGIAGVKTDYKGPVFFDNMRLE